MLHFKPHIVEVLCLAYLDFILGYNVASIFTNLCYYNFNPKANVCVNGKILKKSISQQLHNAIYIKPAYYHFLGWKNIRKCLLLMY